MEFKKSDYKNTDIRNLHNINIDINDDNNIYFRCRIHNIRTKGNLCFIIGRYQTHTIQIVAMKKTIGEDKFKQLKTINLESFVDFYGKLKLSPVKIEYTFYKNFELELHDYVVVNLSKIIPFGIDDANDYGDSFRSDVKFNTRMEHRMIDLRTPVNNSIFKIKSSIVQLFRQYLLNNNFMEINSPKLIGTTSEGGAQVFKVDYFNKNAYLAQSPQLYKQMAINSDFDRVFEIGPVFRAENSLNTRHMCEFTGLDLEMTLSPNKDYYELLHFIWNMLVFIFDNLKKTNINEINIIKEKLPFDELTYPEKPVIIKFCDCVQMLKEYGKIQEDLEDLNTENERLLGELIKKKFNTDLVIIEQYPSNVRPFYTKISDLDSNYSYGFDILLRGVEISSGSQRENNYDTLLQNLKNKNISPDNLKYYLESFMYGSRPHGGTGFGLERLVTQFLNLNNVKITSFCYRDPNRLYP